MEHAQGVKSRGGGGLPVAVIWVVVGVVVNAVWSTGRGRVWQEGRPWGVVWVGRP